MKKCILCSGVIKSKYGLLYCSIKCRNKGIAQKAWTPERRKKLSLFRTGDKNPHWFGDNVGYTGIHLWVKRRTKKPTKCEKCHLEKQLDLANISQEYKRDLNDWEWLCRRCHMEKDGRMYRIKNKLIGVHSCHLKMIEAEKKAL